MGILIWACEEESNKITYKLVNDRIFEMQDIYGNKLYSGSGSLPLCLMTELEYVSFLISHLNLD